MQVIQKEIWEYWTLPLLDLLPIKPIKSNDIILNVHAGRGSLQGRGASLWNDHPCAGVCRHVCLMCCLKISHCSGTSESETSAALLIPISLAGILLGLILTEQVAAYHEWYACCAIRLAFCKKKKRTHKAIWNIAYVLCSQTMFMLIKLMNNWISLRLNIITPALQKCWERHTLY